MFLGKGKVNCVAEIKCLFAFVKVIPSEFNLILSDYLTVTPVGCSY